MWREADRASPASTPARGSCEAPPTRHALAARTRDCNRPDPPLPPLLCTCAACKGGRPPKVSPTCGDLWKLACASPPPSASALLCPDALAYLCCNQPCLQCPQPSASVHVRAWSAVSELCVSDAGGLPDSTHPPPLTSNAGIQPWFSNLAPSHADTCWPTCAYCWAALPARLAVCS